MHDFPPFFKTLAPIIRPIIRHKCQTRSSNKGKPFSGPSLRFALIVCLRKYCS